MHALLFNDTHAYVISGFRIPSRYDNMDDLVLRLNWAYAAEGRRTEQFSCRDGKLVFAIKTTGDNAERDIWTCVQWLHPVLISVLGVSHDLYFISKDNRLMKRSITGERRYVDIDGLIKVLDPAFIKMLKAKSKSLVAA